MGILELLLIAVALSMDTFAVGICMGLSFPKFILKKALIIGLYFGIFQAGMPLIGFLAANLFADMINAYASWIAFALLSFLGVKMIIDSRKKEGHPDCEVSEVSLSPRKMLPFAVATSIDAMAVGVSFAFLRVSIIPAVLLIGVTTLIVSMIGVKIGNVFGAKFKSKAEIAGGIILILISLRILLDYLGVISF